MNNSDRIGQISRRVVDIVNPSLIRWGLYALAGFTILLFIFEILCHGIVGTNPIEGTCRHYITSQFIEQATSFSFSLTAFLLVGVVVVSSFVVTETRGLNVSFREFEMTLGEGEVGDESEARIAITEYEDFNSGEHTSSDSGLTTWTVTSRTHRRINREFPGRPEVIHMVEEPGGLGLGGNRYAVRDIEGESFDKELEQGYDHRVKGKIDYGAEFLEGRNYDDYDNEQARIHWLLREEESELRGLERQLRRAVTYSVSASVLGVLILGYPWASGNITDPWLLDISLPETLVYIPASYTFTFIFLGMIGTSVGLLEMLAQLIDR